MPKTSLKGSAFLNPLPVVLITSKENDFINVFTAAWVSTICTKPPMVSVSIRPERLSYEMIKKSGEFTINLPDKSMTKIVDFCGVRSGREIDKIKKFNLSLEEGIAINVPSIEKCPVSLECKVKNIVQLGSHDMFLSEIMKVKVDRKLMDDSGKIHLEKAGLICYSHGEYFQLPDFSLGKFGYSVKKRKNSR